MIESWDGRTRLEDGQACLAMALVYRERGWCPIPLCPPDHIGVGKEHGKNCKQDSWGKAPLIAGWTSFLELPTPDEIQRWWKLWPTANVGLVMGRISCLVGMDLDGPVGEEEMETLANGDLPQTLEFHTPGGGRRVLYRIRSDKLLKTKVNWSGKKSEIRFLGEGAQTAMPPSRHQSGGRYRWVDQLRRQV